MRSATGSNPAVFPVPGGWRKIPMERWGKRLEAQAMTATAVQAGNLFADISAASSPEKEDFAEILARPGLKIERIVSHGHRSPEGFWYDQPQDEWVIVLKGSAGLRFEDEGSARTLNAGDYVFIPAGKRHRVEWTDPQLPTVWLAVHFE
jgi:cupin 2 domain-containing protein